MGDLLSVFAVAPLVGARIEITFTPWNPQISVSLPSWERGLKFVILDYKSNLFRVAPLVGARIEIAERIAINTPVQGRSPRGSAD